MTDQALETASVTRRGDDGVWPDVSSVGKYNGFAVETDCRRNDLDSTGSQLCNESIVVGRAVLSAREVRRDTVRRPRDPVPIELAEHGPLEPGIQAIAIGFDQPAFIFGDHLARLSREPNADVMVLGVVLQVADPVVASRVLTVTPAARSVPWHRRHPARSVEPQSVVAGPPTRADFVGTFENRHSKPQAPKRCRRGQSGRAGTAHHHFVHLVQSPYGTTTTVGRGPTRTPAPATMSEPKR